MGMCPICGAKAKPRTENRDAPFCSARCKAVDLGKWLDEEYRIPTPPETQEEAALLEAAVSAAEEHDGSAEDGSRKSVRN